LGRQASLIVHVGSSSKTEQLRAELTPPHLNEVVSEGVGTTEISGSAGEQIRLAPAALRGAATTAPSMPAWGASAA
jgi:hypothetical protein